MPVELYRTGILFDIIEPIEPIEPIVIVIDK